MVKIYYNRVKSGAWTIEQVPSKYREAVRKMLEADSSMPTGE